MQIIKHIYDPNLCKMINVHTFLNICLFELSVGYIHVDYMQPEINENTPLELARFWKDLSKRFSLEGRSI